jgi:hypothetical protein
MPRSACYHTGYRKSSIQRSGPSRCPEGGELLHPVRGFALRQFASKGGLASVLPTAIDVPTDHHLFDSCRIHRISLGDLLLVTSSLAAEVHRVETTHALTDRLVVWREAGWQAFQAG